jgi:hypothetical protein
MQSPAGTYSLLKNLLLICSVWLLSLNHSIVSYWLGVLPLLPRCGTLCGPAGQSPRVVCCGGGWAQQPRLCQERAGGR